METELYEQECVLIALLKSGNYQAYWDHQKFFDLEWHDDDVLERELEQKLSEYKLDKSERDKARNRRSYINYGWLLELDDFKNAFYNPYRLDFKNGLQAFAGQDRRYAAYAEASKIIHSSSFMLSGTAEDYYCFVMVCLYETVSNLTPWLMEYFKNGEYKKPGKDMNEFRDSVNRDLEQITKNHETILKKYPND